MTIENTASVNFGGKPAALAGPNLKEGDIAPDFEATASDLKPVLLSSIHAPVKIISSVVSLDTGVCSDETHRFEEEISKLGGKAVLITLSMDLPFAQGRFCGGAPKPNTIFLSDFRLADFGRKYGTLIKDLRLLCRAVFVVGKDGRLAHVQYVKETGTHPDYAAVLDAVNKELEKN